MILEGNKILIENEFRKCQLKISNKKIVEIGENLGNADFSFGDLKVIPGLIDTHIHGFAGFDTMDADENALRKMSEELLKAGVTAFLPTTMTAKADDIKKSLAVVGKLVGENLKGAKILGSFAEGPFISAEHRGAQPLEAISKVNFELLEEMIEASSGTLKKIIIAPEIENAVECCKWLSERNILPALGHSSASFAETSACIEAGAEISVHTFNGMRGLHHREPAILGAVMLNDDVFCELIFDKIHVNPNSAKVLLKCKGFDKIVLISDCMRAGGMADGEYMLGDTKTFVKNSVARTAEGNLAGSTLKLIDAVKFMCEELGVSFENAVKMASENPAKSLGIDDIGSIKVGNYADFVVIDDDFQIKSVFVNGTLM